MIRELLPIEWTGREREDQFVQEGKRLIAALEEKYPGYYAADIDPDTRADPIWVILKPKDEYEMDEGL